jgi:hypothetical protein
MSKGPPIDPADMAGNQQSMFGVPTFNVAAQEKAIEGSVVIPAVNQSVVDASVNASFVKDAPNLPFKLFGLEKLFGSKK